MKKLLLIIINVLLIVLTSISIVKGTKIGKIQVYGIPEIKKEDEDLDSLVQDATKLASTDYQKKIDDLNTEIKNYESKKDEYNNMISVSTDGEVASASQIYNNTIDFLLIRIENHAKAEGVTIDLSVTRSSSGSQNVYDLNFTATGPYVGVEEFITDIEDDSKLGFKIEEFKMIAGKGNDEVKATFVCKDITINGIAQDNGSSQVQTQTSDKDTTDNANNTNTTNTTENTDSKENK